MAVAPTLSEVSDDDTADTEKADSEQPQRRRRAWPLHIIAALAFLGMGYWITSGIWADPDRRSVLYNEGDHSFFEWVLGYGVQIVAHGADPFWTGLMNAPIGVNLAANTSITVYAVVFAPLTYLAGPQVTYVTILMLNLAGAGIAWYAFLLRFAVKHKAAAFIGAAFCGFAPGWISHANGHLNWTAAWLPPVLLWWMLRLRTPRRWLLNGIVLGLLMAAGFSIAPEMLFDLVLAVVIFVLVWSLSRDTMPQVLRAAPRALLSLVIGAVVAGALLAYPLYMHFAGPGSFKGTGFNQKRYVEDAAAGLFYPFRSLAGFFGIQRGDLASNQTEGASFWGWPLLALMVIATVLLWWRAGRSRKSTMRALTVVGLLFMVLSFGPRLHWFAKEYHDIPLLYAVVRDWPIFDSALPARFALVTTGVIGITVALLADRVFSSRYRSYARVIWGVAFAAALVPIIPTPVLTSGRATEPKFVADGTWKKYVPRNGVMSALPFSSPSAADAQRWQAYTMSRRGEQYRIPAGYFLGPGGLAGTGRAGAPSRWTDRMFLKAALTGFVDDIDNYDRSRVREDMAYWGVEAVFIPDKLTGTAGPLFRQSLIRTTTDLFGPGQRVEDVLVWRIRPGIDPQSIPGEGRDGQA
ncbi:DUF2079 domain-containing protein [Winogradskya humida]|uniref:Glycosyl transferase n=1 Tax=Winogradskya humida TaxID=113566 RepID=A0ABQ3ZGD0_9ACTN|nr:DUF2079 domain-containing protein [Actinoplanes humidus]GIE17605.1 glycosyl transferase [Actinoplanes humidus]